jgi:predicted ATPase
VEEKDFDARLAKLSHDIDQLDAKLDDKISSLKEELMKLVLGAHLAHIRDTSVVYIDLIITLAPALSKAAKRARDEVMKLSQDYFEVVGKISADEFQKNIIKFREDVNRITRSAGLQEIWKIET